MENTPDISKIIGVIMQNPALISEIAALANQVPRSDAAEETEVSEVKETVAEVSAPPAESAPRKRPHRKELLNAMKPYLSETRRGALDSVASIFDILDVMMRKES